MHLSVRFSFLALTLLLACSPALPTVHSAWVRAAPDGSALRVAYLQITNPGEADWITGVSSDAHNTASLHESLLENGVSRMRSHDRIELPSKSTVSFRPGGLHIMLGKPSRPLSAGDTVRLAVTLRSGMILHADAIVSGQQP